MDIITAVGFCCVVFITRLYGANCHPPLQSKDSGLLNGQTLHINSDYTSTDWSDNINISAVLNSIVKRSVDEPTGLRRTRPPRRRSRKKRTTTLPPNNMVTEMEQNDTISIQEIGRDNQTIYYVWRQVQRENTIELIKQKILRELKMTEPPTLMNITNQYINITFPEIASAFNNMLTDPEQQQDVPNPTHDDITTLILFSESSPLSDFEASNNVIYFDIGQEIINSEILQAELYLFIKTRSWTNRRQNAVAYINVHRIIRTKDGSYGQSNHPDKKKKIIINRRGSTGWQKLNIKSLVEKWIQNNGSNIYGLKIIANPVNPFVVIKPNSPEDEQYKPHLVVKINKGNWQNQIYSQENRICDENSNEEGCCGYPLTVDFKRIGWNWILSPKLYHTHYCSGLCPSFSSFSYSRHPHILRLTKTESGPCCTPVKRSPLKVVFLDLKGILKYKVIDDIIVDTCGCN